LAPHDVRYASYLFDGDTRHKASAEAIGTGTLMAVAPGKGILAHRYADGTTLHTYEALNKPESWISQIDFTDPASAAARIAGEFDGWPPAITGLINDGDTDPLLRCIYTPCAPTKLANDSTYLCGLHI
jgi:hypothetical protein